MFQFGRFVAIVTAIGSRYRRAEAMKTKGALLWGVNEKWSIEEIELGDPVAGEVQIRMEAAGMCHSDHHIVTGATPMPSYPAMGGTRGLGRHHQGRRGRHWRRGRRPRRTVVHPGLWTLSVVLGGSLEPVRSGMGLLSGQAISDGTYRIQARGQNVIPMCARHVRSVHDGARVLRRQDRQGHPVRARGPRRLWCPDRLGSATHTPRSSR